MLCRVDWLSFTFPADTRTDPTTDVPWKSALSGVGRVHNGLRKWLEAEGKFIDGGGRAPFQKSLRVPNCGVMIFYGHKKNLVLVEISGHGCQRLRELNGETKLIERCQNLLTRIDLAADFLDKETPTNFADQRDNNRFKSGASMHSETGETVYVGSRTSDRYARVYRYNPPHPRSQFLRCEMVLRDEQARACAASILQVGVEETTKKVGAAFGWTHELWSRETSNTEALKAWRPADRGGGTVRWLHTQVTPAIARLLEEGHQLTIQEWIAEIAAMCYDLQE